MAAAQAFAARGPLPQLVAALALVVAFAVAALPGDQDQEILIEADMSEFDRSEGVAVYRGNVQITRGGIEIQGDELTLRFVDEELATATVRGSPARFRQAHAGGRPPTEAEARELTYDAQAGLVRLSGAARVMQAGDEFASDDIRYDTRSERVVAGGEPGARIHVTIQPRRMDNDDEDDAEPQP